MATDLIETDDTVNAKIEALLAELGQAADRNYRHNKRLRLLYLICAPYYIGYTFYVMLLHLPVPANYRLALFYLFKISLVSVVLTILPVEALFWKRIAKSTARVETLLRDLNGDARAVGAIVQLCRPTRSFWSVDMAVKILIEMLPSVKASDAKYISDRQMEALLALLTVRKSHMVDHQRSEELPLAILKALEQIGDSRAIEPVRRLTTGRGNRRYHKAAQECLRFLEQHGEERERNRSLLLPSSLEAQPETLLRATTWKEEAQPEQLLRGAAGDET